MEALFLKLVNLSFTAGWLVLAVFVLRLLFRKAPRWIFCMLWGLVAFRLVCPISIESTLSLIPSAEPLPQEILYTAVPHIQSGVNAIDNVVNPILSTAMMPTVSASANPTQIWVFILSCVWVAGMAVMLIYALASYLLLKRRVATATIFHGNIKQGEQVTSPFVLGFFRPAIYLPYGLEDDDLEYVVAHEQAHIRRKDHWWKPIGFVILSVYWFHPLLWTAYILLCRDIETACDEKVIKRMEKDDRRAYCTALLNCSVHRRRIAACPLAFGEVRVKERIKNVMNYKKPAFWIISLAIAATIIAVFCLLTTPKRANYTIGIVVPAGSQEMFVYSHEEISPTGNRITISSGDNLGDTEVVLKLVEGKEEISYEPTYLTSGMPVKMDVEKGAWFKVGVNIQNPTDKDIVVFVNVKNIQVRISEDINDSEQYRTDNIGNEELLSKAINAAIIDQNKPEGPDNLFRCASFVLLDQEKMTVNSGDTPETEFVTVYGIALYQAYQYTDVSFNEVEGSYIPTAMTFDVRNNEYTLTEYWTPRDGEYYIQDIRNRFPDEVEEDALDITKYSLAQIQDCYDQAIRFGSVDTDAVVEALFKVIEASPAAEADPGAYINAHPIEYRELTYYGEYTLSYIFSKFLEGSQTGLRGHLMQAVLDDLAPEAALGFNAKTGQEYFDAWQEEAEKTYAQQGEKWMIQNQPAALFLLQMMDESLYSGGQ